MWFRGKLDLKVRVISTRFKMARANSLKTRPTATVEGGEVVIAFYFIKVNRGHEVNIYLKAKLPRLVLITDFHLK